MKAALFLALAVTVFFAPVAQASTSLVLHQQTPKDGYFCNTCISFMNTALDELLQIIAQSGVLGSCNALCSQLNNQVEGAVCNLLCDYVGINEFINLVDDADPDPIFYCQELSVCPTSKTSAAQWLSAVAVPKSGPAGTTFNINVVYRILNTTGTGTIEFDVNPPNGDPFGAAGLLIEVPPGTYSAQFQVQTQASEQEPFSPGSYPVACYICEGTCGSIHSYARTLAATQVAFTITQ
eukprot:TRINITY_DN10988_c0_g1_i1.p1 TRINITY_DN10988_c0_g1~~TRINITY_DN10988_c0_g1_i1.p1  ORF type:complete len:237 (+),score=57.62 TRINITY_DN10988_c0_g1_i1:30-740(+)